MLARTALRMAAVEALRSKTLVGDNVLDSEIGALDVAADGALRTNEDKPFIAVYTEASRAEGSMLLEQRALHRSGSIEIVFEFGVTAAMLTTDPETGESVVVPGLPMTDRAIEFYLDCVGRQIVNALTDPSDAWAELFRALSSRITKIDRRRAMASGDTATRMAAHQLVIAVDLLSDPIYGEELSGVWVRFFDKLDESTDPVIVTKAALLRSLIGDTSGATAAGAHQRRFGMTLEEVRALLNAPLVAGSEPDTISVDLEITR